MTEVWSVTWSVVEQIFISFCKPKTLLNKVERYRSGHNGADSKSVNLIRRLVEVIEVYFNDFLFCR